MSTDSRIAIAKVHTLVLQNTSSNLVRRAIQDIDRLTTASFSDDFWWYMFNYSTVSAYKQGSYELAVSLAKKAVKRAKEIGVANHPDLAKSLNNLAQPLRAQGKYAQAKPLYKRALAIREKALGPDHPDVAESLNNLAELYRAQAQHARAEPLHKRALAIREKALGLDHPRVAASLNNLAALYHEQRAPTQVRPPAIGLRTKLPLA